MGILIPGHEPSMTTWQWLYMLNFGLVLPLLMIPIATQMHEKRLGTPTWIALGAGVGILVWFTPLLIVPTVWLPVLQIGLGAPFLAGLISSMFSVGCLVLAMHSMFPWMRTLRMHE
jgi:hypothetical protein